jgi:hypothetical protein
MVGSLMNDELGRNGNGHGLFQGTIPEFSAETEEIHEKPSVQAKIYTRHLMNVKS